MTRSHLLLALGLAAGCGGDAAPAADARDVDAEVVVPPDAAAPDADPDAPDLTCLGDAAATAGADPLAVTGKVFAVAGYQVTPAAGAAVELRRRGDGALLAQAAADAEGGFELAVAGGAAIDAVVVVTAADHLPTRAFPADPLVGGEDLLLLVVDAAELAAWYQDAGDAYDPGDRTVLAAVVDCARDPIRGSTLTVAPAPAALTYYDDQAQVWDPALAASSNGFTLASGAAASVTLTSAPLPPRTVPAAPDELTLALISPREPG
jgi:hypothetical protein